MRAPSNRGRRGARRSQPRAACTAHRRSADAWGAQRRTPPLTGGSPLPLLRFTAGLLLWWKKLAATARRRRRCRGAAGAARPGPAWAGASHANGTGAEPRRGTQLRGADAPCSSAPCIQPPLYMASCALRVLDCCDGPERQAFWIVREMLMPHVACS
ncbi:MAG: hypothetical protein J3K34DRAFT_426212 [Monoraphidium minutum]|nr:MAG: hypothetical protein J3K34DRAFT_426212 [Monoraphidium minutum]